jgi:hypothetical protein
VDPSSWRATPDAALLFGLNSSTGKHHFDPVSRGCQLGWHCFDEAARQAGLAITANDFRQPSLDIDQAPCAVVVISQKIRQSATSPSSWLKAAKGHRTSLGVLPPRPRRSNERRGSSAVRRSQRIEDAERRRGHGTRLGRWKASNRCHAGSPPAPRPQRREHPAAELRGPAPRTSVLSRIASTGAGS